MKACPCSRLHVNSLPSPGRSTNSLVFDGKTAILIQSSTMTTLAEIESAAETLAPVEKQELLLFLAARMRASGSTLPAPRRFTREQVSQWIAEDEADWKRLQDKG